MMKSKKRNPLKITIILLLFALMAVTLLISCTRSEGRDIGSKIWGNARSVNPPADQGIGNSMICIDDVNIFAVTKSDGYFSISGIPDGNIQLSLWKYGYEIFKGSVSVNRDTTRGVMDFMPRNMFAQFAFEFPQGETGDESLAATILDSENQPVVGAEIDLVYLACGYFFVTQTDSSGSFYLIETLPPDPDLLIIDAKGFKPAIFEHDDIVTLMDAGIDGAIVNLIPIERDTVTEGAPKCSVSGVISDESEQTLLGIKVALIPVEEDKNPVESIARITETDGQGKYTFEDIVPGDYIVWAGHPDFFPNEVKVTLEDGNNKTVNMTLEDESNQVLHPYFRPPLR
jgi:hypothetical protein